MMARGNFVIGLNETNVRLRCYPPFFIPALTLTHILHMTLTSHPESLYVCNREALGGYRGPGGCGGLGGECDGTAQRRNRHPLG